MRKYALELLVFGVVTYALSIAILIVVLAYPEHNMLIGFLDIGIGCSLTGWFHGYRKLATNFVRGEKSCEIR
jgi:hypothetical protein